MDATLLIARMQPTLAAQPAVAVAWLFGSAARGTMRSDSDVDVAIVFVEGVLPAERERILVDLSSRLESATSPHPIEVVDLAEQGWVFIHRALIDGKRIVVNDEERRVEFEANAHVRYLDWKPTWDIAANEQQAGMRRWLARQRRA
ncbi:MAG: nucleotidyltransferase domain-containing protein [Planctomycetota bacterium]